MYGFLIPKNSKLPITRWKKKSPLFL